VRITHTKERKKKYKLPHPSLNVHSKIIKPWLSEGYLPRALRCVSQTKFLTNMAKTEFREQGTHPLLTTATQERGLVSA
jgi:hypothetical protein